MAKKDEEVCEEVSIEHFRECSFEFEIWVEACLQRQNFEETRLNLERLYRETKNATMTLARDSIEDFSFGADGRLSESDNGLSSELILKDLESQNQEIKKAILILDTRLNRLSTCVKNLNSNNLQRENLIRILKIIEYNDYLQNVKNALLIPANSHEKLNKQNVDIVICVEIVFELEMVEKLQNPPKIIDEIVILENGIYKYKYLNDFYSIFVKHLKETIELNVDKNNFFIEDKILPMIDKILLLYEKIPIVNQIEKLFIIYIDKMIQDNSANIFEAIFENISNKNSIFNYIIIFSLENNLKLNILTNSVIRGLTNHFSKTNYLMNDPDYFHSIFIQMENFLSNVESSFFSAAEIRIFRKDKNVSDLMKCFNVLKYFQNRRRSFIEKIDCVLSENTRFKDGTTFREFIESLVMHLRFCFNPNIILPHLIGRFWGLFLQAIYIITSSLKIEFEATKNDSETIQDIILIQTLIENLRERIISMTNEDLICYLISKSISKSDVIQTQMADVDSCFNNVKSHFNEILYNHIVLKLGIMIEETKNVPRFYRNTNHGIPVEPSSNVIEIISFITNLDSNYSDRVFISKVITSTTDKFMSTMETVTDYVKKSESSILRLKSMSGGGGREPKSSNDPDSHNDFHKIYKQLQIDKEYIVTNFSNILNR